MEGGGGGGGGGGGSFINQGVITAVAEGEGGFIYPINSNKRALNFSVDTMCPIVTLRI